MKEKIPYCLDLPKEAKQLNSYSQMWLIEQLYIKLGWEELSTRFEKKMADCSQLILSLTLPNLGDCVVGLSNFLVPNCLNNGILAIIRQN